jgi:hypothetical protein
VRHFAWSASWARLSSGVRQRHLNTLAKVCVALALAQGSLLAAHAGTEPQRTSAAEVVKSITISRMSAIGDICVQHLPATKDAWSLALSAVNATTDRVVTELMASPVFNSLENEKLSSDAASAFLDTADNSKREMQARVEKLDLDSLCPQSLKRVQTLNVEYVRAMTAQLLASVQLVLIGQKEGYIN